VWDFKGLNWAHRQRAAIVKYTAQLAKDHYPERVEKMIFINAPWMFPALFRLIKTFMDPHTLSKIEFIQGNPTKRLLELIDADNLPEEYGGTCKCDGGCVPVVDRETLEKEAALEKEKEKTDKKEEVVMDLKEQQVAARFSTTVSVHSGGYLEEERKNRDFGLFGWCVKLASYDIKLTATFTPDNKESSKVTVIPETRCSTHEGSFMATEPGRFDLTFDNTYSRLRSKTIKYAITFATQHDHEDKEKESVETVAAKSDQDASED